MTTKPIKNDIEAFIALKPVNFRFLKSLSLNKHINSQAHLLNRLTLTPGCLERYSRYDFTLERYSIEIIAASITDEKIQNLRIECLEVFNLKRGCTR